MPADKLKQAKRVIYGLNLGEPVGELQLDAGVLERAKAMGFDLRSALFRAAPEQMRPPRIVRIGLIQNKIVLPTTAPFAAQAQVRDMRAVCFHAYNVVLTTNHHDASEPFVFSPRQTWQTSKFDCPSGRPSATVLRLCWTPPVGRVSRWCVSKRHGETLRLRWMPRGGPGGWPGPGLSVD